MSYRLNGLAEFEPTGCVWPPALELYQAYRVALLSSSLHQNRVARPARAAYSHSDSLGRRYGPLPAADPRGRALPFSQDTYACASSHVTHTTGSRSVWLNPGFRQLV